jgi:Flp pilus assembly protein TadG
MVYKILEPSGLRNATTKETTEIDARQKEWNDASATRKLAQIRSIRNQLLQDTDWKVTMAKEKGTTLSSGFKTWRDNLRKIPQDYTTETKYDELLARDTDGNLTHSVWSE